VTVNDKYTQQNLTEVFLLSNFASNYKGLGEYIADPLVCNPGRSVSEFLDPGLWEPWHDLAAGITAPPPFLDTAPAVMTLKPVADTGPASNWIFWVLLAGFAILTMIRYYHERRLKLLTASIFKRSSALQLIRESPVYSHRSFFPLLSIYIISFTLLIQQASEIFSPGSTEGIMTLLFFAQFLGIYLVFSLLKILAIWLISVTFKNTETAREYIQNILIYNLVLGMLLLPMLLLIIYSFHEIFLYITAGIIFFILGLRFFRGVAIGLSDPKFSLFHLFLYLCTLEILPYAIAAKFLSKYFIT
jgi:hypothetical protein